MLPIYRLVSNVSEETTTSMKSAQSNCHMHVLFGGARGPAICVRTATGSAAAGPASVPRPPSQYSIRGGENNHRLGHTFLNLLLSDVDSEERRELVRSTDSEDRDSEAARWKCLQ